MTHGAFDAIGQGSKENIKYHEKNWTWVPSAKALSEYTTIRKKIGHDMWRISRHRP